MTTKYSLRDLAKLLQARLVGNAEQEIHGVDTLEDASEQEASFLAHPRYLDAMKRSKAGAICVAEGVALEEGKNYLVTSNPSQTFQNLLKLFFLPGSSAFQGIHPTAVIDPSVELGDNVTVGPFAVLDRGVRVGAGTVIGAHVFLGHDVKVGNQCTLYPHSVVREQCELHHRVILQPHAVIGSCGFGYAPDAKGHFHKLEQLGIVVLEDDVEIGAHTAVDRARFKETRIHRGTKIDNLCQIAHNVEIGEDTVIAAQTGIAGSSRIGNRCMFGGQVGILGHITVGDEVLVATRGGVSKDLKKGQYRGSPAMPIQDYHRQEVHVRKLAGYVERLKKLEEQKD